MFEKRNHHGCLTRRARPILWLMPITAALAACTTSTPAPDQMLRTTSDTAPADLQLLCAEAAKAGRSGTALPISSRKLDGNNYQVDLNVDGTPKVCIVSAAGSIVSVQAS